MARKSALVIALMAALSSSSAFALGLGDIVVRSGLNQPLEADIPLLSAQDVDSVALRANLASPEAFDRAGVERTYFLNTIRFNTVTLPDGRKVVRLRTQDPVKEPFLNFIVEVNWPAGRLQREYTLLMDPPTFAQEAKPAAIAPARGGAWTKATGTPAPAYTGTYSGDTYGPTGANDTLWSIAGKVRNGHSTAQTMVALYQANPDAFTTRNMNSLKRGATLKVPSGESIDAVSMAEARRLMIAHNQAWASRSGVADQPSAVLEAGQGGGATAVGEAGDDSGRLKLVAPSSGSAKGEGALRDRLSNSMEAQQTLSKENEELRSQVGELASQVEKMERLIKLKDQQLATLQSGQPAATAAETAPVSAQTPATGETATSAANVPASSEVPTTETPAVAASAPTTAGAEPESAETPAATAPETPPAVTTPKPETVKAAAKPTTRTIRAPEEPSLLDTLLGHPLWLGLGGGALVIILLGIILVVRRRQAEEAFKMEPAMAPINLRKPEPEIPAAPELDIPDIEALDETPTVDEAPTATAATVSQNFDHIADPIGEADIYIAYGKLAQAEELLKATLAKTPERHEARLKLLECYAETRNREAFEAEAAKLRDLAEVDESVAGKIVELFESAWHGDSFTLFAAPRRPSSDDLPSADDIFASLDVGSESSLAAQVEPEAPAHELNDEFALDETKIASADFDGFGSPKPEAERFEFDLNSEAETAADKGLEFSLEGFDMPKSEEPAPSSAEPVADEFSLDADLAAFDEVHADPSPAPGLMASGEETLDFDLDADLAHAEPSLGGLSADDEDLLAGSDEAATKLDLAKAYLDMGDHEGARDILSEVLAEGNLEQKQEAEALLSKLA